MRLGYLVPTMNVDNDRPFRCVWLKPVPKPTSAQIKFFHQHWGYKYESLVGNYLGSRKMLIRGGFPVVGCDRISESLRSLLRELDELALPYQVETLPIDNNGVVLRRFDSTSQPNWFDTGESTLGYEAPRHVVLQLTSITNRDEFVELMDEHFPCGRNADKIWQSFHNGLTSRPFTVEFRGWPIFAKRMPLYARRIRDFVNVQEKFGAAGFHAEFID
jgi:hypothetical protein